MEVVPFLLLYFAAWFFVGWYAYIAELVPYATTFAVLVNVGMAVLPQGNAQLIPWTVLLAAAARAGRLLVIRQNQQADR